ncbi:PREDICTED: calexcitin-2-like [Papilio polytes]|uniref:calexcitin-2-like n=1 Tax=Papilio polytes TaxID=76194 RepID=UPI0006764C43|nr:PREDICTED: calexcitin-2-like [Papilio polytes]
MVSDFRRKKLMFMFKFLDKDGSGTIEKKDFLLAAEHAAKQRGWAEGSDLYKECFDTVEMVWDALEKVGDANSDGQVSADEWVTMWDTISKSAADRDWLNKYCKFVFKMQDLNGDGFIDSDDFVAASTKSGNTKENALEAFQKLSQGKSQITLTDFQKLWDEYFITEDPNAPGNFISGRPSFD